jgi:dipeptidyl-peptidase 4
MNVVRRADGRASFEFPVYPLMPWDIASYDLQSLKDHRAPGTTLTFWPSAFYGRYVPTKWVSRPAAYLVRASETKAIAHLKLHKIRTEPARAGQVFARAETYAILDVLAAGSQIGGLSRKDEVFSVRTEQVRLTAGEGDVIVPLDQPLGSLALFLLEPESDDGLARWGFFENAKAGTVFPVARILAENGVGGAQ